VNELHKTREGTMAEGQLATTKLAEMPIGEIAARLPGATALFRLYKLDYCCGGASSLQSAAARRGIDVAEVESRLAALNQPMVAASEDPGDLVEFILSRYHETHRRELVELCKLAQRVEKVHADHPQAPLGLTEFLADFAFELDSHMQKEEAILFPMMKAGNPMVVGPIAAMMAQHEDHAGALERLEAIAHGMEPPAEACGSWRALYSGLRKLSDDLKDHIHTENNVLFPQFSGR
jgi:regulator of cell morphogenesis and NO signaling